jgi:anthranilate phosphoribosyltransferase
VSNTSTPDWSALLQQIIDKASLSTEQAEALMQGWLAEAIDPILSGAILAAIQAKGVSGEELAGMARVLQAQSLGGGRGRCQPTRTPNRHLWHRG